MNGHFSDTTFGQVVRLISRRRFLKFPDESDPNLWKQCIQKDTMRTSSTSEQHNGPVEPSNHIAADDSDGGEKGREASEHFLRNERNLNSAITNKKSGEVILVGWYGPYDQEV